MCANETGADGTASRPNFVIILADDLGYGDLGCFGNSQVATPHIDRLAEEGALFTDFHSSGAVCSPTRAGLLTGRYQQRAGIPGVIAADPRRGLRHQGLQPHEVTFADVLRAAGYATAICGKWHLGYEKRYNPVRHGFDSFRGYVSGNVDYFSHIDQAGFADLWHDETLVAEEGYTTRLITQHAVRFLEANAHRPFCLYVAHEAVHSPYQGPNDGPVRDGSGHRAERRDRVQAYREMTEELDRGVGSLVATLARLGIAEQTLVFFFSDNGAVQIGSNGVLRGGKGTLWEGGHRIPAIARWPGRIPAGRRCAAQSISLDLMPTMLALAGAAAPDRPLDGVDLSPVLFGTGSLRARDLFWEHGEARAMRRSRWKLIAQEAAGVQLFDLDADLCEQSDVAQQHQAVVAEMMEQLRGWHREVWAGATVQPAP